MGRDALEERGLEGVGNPTLCVPKMVHTCIPFVTFISSHYPPPPMSVARVHDSYFCMEVQQHGEWRGGHDSSFRVGAPLTCARGAGRATTRNIIHCFIETCVWGASSIARMYALYLLHLWDGGGAHLGHFLGSVRYLWRGFTWVYFSNGPRGEGGITLPSAKGEGGALTWEGRGA